METSKNVFIACAIGGGVGAFLAHQFWYPSLWSILLGFIVGGLASYLTYEFKTVLRAIPVAWNRTTSWWPDREWWKLYAKNLPYCVNFVLNIAIVIFLVTIMPTVIINQNHFGIIKNPGTLLSVWLTSILLSSLLISILTVRDLIKNPEQTFASDFGQMRFMVSNPFRIYLWIAPKYLIKSIWWVIKGSWCIIERTLKAVAVAFIFTIKFTKTFLRIIHSELRLLCLVYGGIGAVAGTLIADTLTGTLVGALAGGVLGVISFEAISKRILHLAPSTR